MSTHYTSSKVSLVRLIRWKRLVFELLAPLLLIISVISAWVDNVLYKYYILWAAWLYLFALIGKLHGSKRALQFHAIAGSAFFIFNGLASLTFDTPESPLSPYLMAGLLFGVIAMVVESHTRIDKLEAPSKTSRATEFPGIYRITCKPNGMQYIGMTERPIKVRWNDHRTDMEAQRHHNPRMQLDWNTYRPEQFKWEVLEVVTDPVWLRDRERAWQDKDYDSSKRYNPPNLPPRMIKHRRPSMRRK